MSIAALRKHAQSLPSEARDVKWGADCAASVGATLVLAGMPKKTQKEILG